MFFMMGITQGRTNIEHNQGVIVCQHCGSYGRYQVFMTYMVLSLFFIPCFKWNKRYFVQTTCCKSIYELDPEIGRRLKRGEDVEILPEHMTLVYSERPSLEEYERNYHRCSNCGYETTEDFEFCPKCGLKF